jgi:hypothetical protein
MNMKLAASLLMLAGSASAQNIRAVPQTGLAPALGSFAIPSPALSGGWESFSAPKLDSGLGSAWAPFPSATPAPQALAAAPAPARPAASVEGFQPEDLRTRELVSGFDQEMTRSAEADHDENMFDGGGKKKPATILNDFAGAWVRSQAGDWENHAPLSRQPLAPSDPQELARRRTAAIAASFRALAPAASAAPERAGWPERFKSAGRAFLDAAVDIGGLAVALGIPAGAIAAVKYSHGAWWSIAALIAVGAVYGIGFGLLAMAKAVWR